MNELMSMILNGLPDDSKEHDIATSLANTLKGLSWYMKIPTDNQDKLNRPNKGGVIRSQI